MQKKSARGLGPDGRTIMAKMMSAAMWKAYSHIMNEIDRATTKTFPEWFSGSEEKHIDWVINHVVTIGERRTRKSLEKARRRYELAQQGIVGTGSASYRTIEALRSRGTIEIVEDAEIQHIIQSGYAVRIPEPSEALANWKYAR